MTRQLKQASELVPGDTIVDDDGNPFTVTEKHRGYTIGHYNFMSVPGVLRGDQLYEVRWGPSWSAAAVAREILTEATP